MKRVAWVAAFLLLVAVRADAAPDAPELSARVAGIAREVLAATGTPAASIAIVRDGRIVLAEAYGDAQAEPRVPARPEQRFGIGSVSKQFTAAAVLLLAEEKKLSLDDPVSKFVPGLERGKDVRVRDLLAHVSGYRDYWPQDYVPRTMLEDIRPADLLERWARPGLDFEPGAQWQYSNTGYTAAGLIVEHVAGEPLFEFLRKRVFVPLGMDRVADFDGRRPDGDARGYTRYGFGPIRPAPLEGRGWLFAMGSLAMPASDLARWDLAVMDRKLLAASSWAEMETEVRLASGLGTKYGLGLALGKVGSHRELSHDGEISGFLSVNRIFPNDRAAVAVLTNDDVGDAAAAIADRIVPLLFAEDAGKKADSEARARRVLEDLRRGRIDRALLSENASAYFSDEALADYAASLAKLGPPKALEQTSRSSRGGLTTHRFSVTTKKRTYQVVERDLPDGRIEQFIVTGKP